MENEWKTLSAERHYTLKDNIISKFTIDYNFSYRNESKYFDLTITRLRWIRTTCEK